MPIRSPGLPQRGVAWCYVSVRSRSAREVAGQTLVHRRKAIGVHRFGVGFVWALDLVVAAYFRDLRGVSVVGGPPNSALEMAKYRLRSVNRPGFAVAQNL